MDLSLRFNMSAVCAALTLALAPNLAAASPMGGQAPVAEIPYNMSYQGWFTVEANVNGDGPHDFIVDSGASITAIFQNLADQQTFEPADREPIRILGLVGSATLPAYTLGDIDFGEIGLEDHVGVILPDWNPPLNSPQGILGLDFLAQYTVHIDVDDRKIALYPYGSRPRDLTRGWTRTELKPTHIGEETIPLYRANVTVRGKRIPCIIDLGASGTIFNYAAYGQMLGGVVVNGNRRNGFTTGTRINDVFGSRRRARVIEIAKLSMGGARWRNKQFVVYDAEIFNELGLSGRPYCLIGADLLSDRSFLFDFADEHLYIGPES